MSQYTVNETNDNWRPRNHSFWSEPVTRYVVLITSIIALLVVIQVIHDGPTQFSQENNKFLSDADKQLATNFVEWFGVLYGFLLPTILVRVWEQFDTIDNLFDKESDAINSLVGDLTLLPPQYHELKRDILILLEQYTSNVISYLDEKISPDQEAANGKKILTNIRKLYLGVFYPTNTKTKEIDVLIDELLTQLNNVIDYRGDRISLTKQRLFESLKYIAIITSIVWLVPFYFLYFQDQSGNPLQLGTFGWLLIIAVASLVIMILTIIEDLDEPLGGHWRVNSESWLMLRQEIIEITNLPPAHEIELERNSSVTENIRRFFEAFRILLIEMISQTLIVLSKIH